MVVVAVLASAVLVLRDDRGRALAMLGALVVSPPLLLASIWHDNKLHFGLVADAGAVPDVAVLGQGVRDGFARLQAEFSSPVRRAARRT